MTVVSDTSPLNYLAITQCEDLLKTLFRKIAVPAAVMSELHSENAPAAVREWLGGNPDWIEVHQVQIPENYLSGLGHGEREAIYLATKIGADALLMDETKGRIAAQRLNLHVMGTLGILDAAALRHLVDLPSVLGKLKETTFRATPDLLESLLKKHAQ